MENKLRGQKHRLNKQRFQDKSKVVQKSDKLSKNATPKFIHKLESNWSRYDEQNEDCESQQKEINESTNFSLLSKVPISGGGHFQFKSDKNLESEYDFESLRGNKLFSLDLNVLVSSLNTIPFHERCDVDPTYLTEHQLNQFNIEAQQCQIQYESMLKVISIAKGLDEQCIVATNNIEQSVSEKSDSDILKISDTADKQLFESGTKVTHSQAHSEMSQQKDLEEWLDDVLDS